MFLSATSSSSPVLLLGFCGMFPGLHPCFCIRGFLPLSFVFMHGFIPISVGGCCSLHLFEFFLLFGRTGLLVVFVLPVLCHSSVFLRRVFEVSFLRSGFSVLGISRLVPVSLHTWSLRVSFFRSWLRPFPLCSSSPLCVLIVLHFGLGPFLRFLVLGSSPRSSSSLCFLFLVLFFGHFLQFLVPSLLRVGLFLSYLPVFRASPASSSLLSRSFLPQLLVIFWLCSVCALWGSLSRTLAVSLRHRSLFVYPLSPLRSLLGPLSVSFPFGVFTFLFPGFSVWFLLWLLVLCFSC